MEENRNTEEVVETPESTEEKEERAYVSSIWSTKDLLTECLTIQEKILTVINHHYKNVTSSPFKDSDIKAFKNAYKVLSNCMMSIAEPTPPTTTTTESVVSEGRSLEDETKEVTEETTEEVTETTEDTKNVENKEEERSVDPLQAFKDRLKNLKENK